MPLKKSLAVAALALGAAPPSFAADPVKIGLVLPMSGPFAAYGKQIEHGVKLYLAHNGDTFAGRKVELIVKDDSPGPPATSSKRLAQELVVKDKVDILAGFGLTPAALAVAPCRDRGEEADGRHERGDVDHHDQVALHRARVDDAAAGHRADGDLGGEERHQEGLHAGRRLRPGHRRRRRSSRRRSRRPAARSSARCACR